MSFTINIDLTWASAVMLLASIIQIYGWFRERTFMKKLADAMKTK